MKERESNSGLAGIRRPPPLNFISTTPPSRPSPSTSANRCSPRPQNEHTWRSNGDMYMYRIVLRWVLEFMFMCVIPSCSSWFCCVCIPVALPFGFVMFASPPAFLESAISNWTLRQVVFYAVWWIVGPVWVTAWALRSFSAAIEEIRREPPKGLLVASATLPVFLTPLWWGFLWYTSFPTMIGLSVICAWFFNDPRIKSLGKSIAQIMRGEEFKSFVATITGTVKVAQQWCERERPRERSSASRPVHPSSRPVHAQPSEKLTHRRQSRANNKAMGQPTSILKHRSPPPTLSRPQGFVSVSWAAFTTIIWQVWAIISAWLLYVTGRGEVRQERRLGEFTMSGSLLSSRTNGNHDHTNSIAGVWNSSIVDEQRQQQHQKLNNLGNRVGESNSQTPGDSQHERLPLRMPANGMMIDKADVDDDDEEEDGICIDPCEVDGNDQEGMHDGVKGGIVRKPGTPWFRPTLPSDASDSEKEMLVATQEHVATPALPGMSVCNGSIDRGVGNGSMVVDDANILREQAWGVAPRNVVTAPAALKRREDDDGDTDDNTMHNTQNKLNGYIGKVNGHNHNNHNNTRKNSKNNLANSVSVANKDKLRSLTSNQHGHGVSVLAVGGVGSGGGGSAVDNSNGMEIRARRVRYQRRNSS